MEHVKKTMSKDRRQQKHRCTMMREKIKNDQTQRKGSKSKNNKLQNKANLTTELKQQMDLNNANKHLSTNIASNTFKKNRKTNKTQTNTHTHTEQKETTPKTPTHTESQKLTAKRALTHTHEATTNQDYLFRNCTKTTAN